VSFFAGIAAVGYCGVARITILDVQFENLSDAIHAETAATPNPGVATGLIVENCSFINNYFSIIKDCNTTSISGCTARSNLRGARFLADYLGAPVLLTHVDNCRSEFSNQGAAHLSSSAKVFEVIECDLFGETTFRSNGISSDSQTCIISRTSVSGARRGVAFYGNDVQIQDCSFDNVGMGVWLMEAPCFLSVENCQFAEIRVSSISYDSFTRGGRINNCILEKGEEFAVSHSIWGKAGGQKTDVVTIDMTNNWWGTTEPDSIRAWIEDSEDDPDWPFTVEWAPFLNGPVSTEAKTLDGLRALYR
jgi:hypothetical protein